MVEQMYNFNPGPAALPLPVLERARDEFLDYKGTGMSILEISHRSKEFDDVINNACTLIKEVYNVPSEYKILWLQGGASSQFYMVPSNLMKNSADYVNTGTWSRKAIKEATTIGIPIVAVCSTDNDFRNVDLVIPANNKGRRSLAVLFWLLTRQVLRERQEIPFDGEIEYTIDDFEVKLTDKI